MATMLGFIRKISETFVSVDGSPRYGLEPVLRASCGLLVDLGSAVGPSGVHGLRTNFVQTLLQGCINSNLLTEKTRDVALFARKAIYGQ
mmetsp:Transcript_2422/g.4749  ORF Transcript_2422/g.4749 Transcript_2422/m.4749 type:complete len:89 (+) Transcript_2422:50-316(+)